MFSTILSGTVCGIHGQTVHVEVDVSTGLPCFLMVGFLSSEVKEAGERVRVALKNAGFALPPMHITVNLSPADVRKEGTCFDLPIALGILTAMEKLPAKKLENTFVAGELGLDGEIKPVRGILPLADCARRQKCKRLIVPKDNETEAAVYGELEVVGAETLRTLIEYLQGKSDPGPIIIKEESKQNKEITEDELDFGDIVGQETLKRAAVIAAAGFHHLLLSGPPGSGKTMIARRIPALLPPLTQEESMEVSMIYSVAGRLEGDRLISERPFVSPHHTITGPALIGGGRGPLPGAVTLAHRGVLFLDELPEFRKQIVDILRQPLEEGEVHIARTYGSFIYPAQFMLIAAMNPCPCGYFPDRNRCSCTEYEIKRYRSHISGPILDRMDLCVEAPRVDIRKLTRQEAVAAKKHVVTSKDMQEQVTRARKQQKIRYGNERKTNGELTAKEIRQYCVLGSEEEAFLEQMYEKLQLGARSYHKLLRVSRTIADLEESEQITGSHLAEAICYRMVEYKE